MNLHLKALTGYGFLMSLKVLFFLRKKKLHGQLLRGFNRLKVLAMLLTEIINALLVIGLCFEKFLTLSSDF